MRSGQNLWLSERTTAKCSESPIVLHGLLQSDILDDDWTTYVNPNLEGTSYPVYMYPRMYIVSMVSIVHLPIHVSTL